MRSGAGMLERAEQIGRGVFADLKSFAGEGGIFFAGSFSSLLLRGRLLHFCNGWPAAGCRIQARSVSFFDRAALFLLLDAKSQGARPLR